MNIKFLSEDEVLKIHDALVEDFQRSGDPIDPPGVKNKTMLASAVSRQQTSLQGVYKYPEPFSNAATLTFGLCNDHPFHNGNKRTALVALIVHLHKNGYSLVGVRHKELYNMILAVAQHKIAQEDRKKKSRFIPERTDPDTEIEAISQWIKTNARKVKKGEQQLTYRDLRSTLGRFSFSLEKPNKNVIEVVKYVDKKTGFWGNKSVRERIHIGSIPYPGDNTFVSLRTLKYVRRLCKLEEKDGVDSDAFYRDGEVIDAFINDYRKTLERLTNK